VVAVPAWQERYQEALLELRPEELPRRIKIAEKEISERLEEISRRGDISDVEQQGLEDAMRRLRVLAQTECRTQHRSEGGSDQSGAA